MGQVLIKLDDGRDVVAGWDEPFKTWFAQLFEAPRDDVGETDEPTRTLGYHPAERALTPGCDHGRYPIATLAELLETLRSDWGIILDAHQRKWIAADKIAGR